MVERTIIAFSPQGFAVAGVAPEFSCSNLFGNAYGDWEVPIADQAGIRGNFSADPFFCDAAGGDLTLAANSPCLPGNHPDGYDCDLIGAHGEGCAAIGVDDGLVGSLTTLLHASPNPFTSSSRISFVSSSAGPASVIIFDLGGRRVRAFDALSASGTVSWDGRDAAGRPLAAGTYFVRLESGQERQTGRLQLIR